MSWLGLKRRLLPSKKAMRVFTTLLKSNLHKLRRSNTVSTDFSLTPMRRRHLHQPLKRAQSFSAVYVDDLFSCQPAAEENTKQQAEETSAVIMKLQKPHKQSCRAGDSMSNVGETAAAIWDVDELGGVDLRAEMFIRKFKEEMKLQRQKSFGEYQAMLARGADIDGEALAGWDPDQDDLLDV